MCKFRITSVEEIKRSILVLTGVEENGSIEKGMYACVEASPFSFGFEIKEIESIGRNNGKEELRLSFIEVDEIGYMIECWKKGMIIEVRASADSLRDLKHALRKNT